MKNAISTISLMLGCLVLNPAQAQPGPGMGDMGGMGMGPNARPLAGCDKAADTAGKALCEQRRKANAEARQKAVDACKDVAGPDHRRCIRDVRMATEDCSKAPQPERCQAIKSAYDKCKEKRGPEMRACMRDSMPAPDCSKAPDQARCAANHQAKEACKDTPVGPQRRQCMTEQGAVKK